MSMLTGMGRNSRLWEEIGRCGLQRSQSPEVRFISPVERHNLGRRREALIPLPATTPRFLSRYPGTSGAPAPANVLASHRLASVAMESSRVATKRTVFGDQVMATAEAKQRPFERAAGVPATREAADALA